MIGLQMTVTPRLVIGRASAQVQPKARPLQGDDYRGRLEKNVKGYVGWLDSLPFEKSAGLRKRAIDLVDGALLDFAGQKTGWNKTQMAKLLGINRNNLQTKLKRLRGR